MLISIPLRPRCTRPGMLYFSNTSELGHVYTKSEFDALCDFAEEHNLAVYVDGARMASALTAQGGDLSLEHLAARADACTLGGTKNGMLFGEALVINPRTLGTFELTGFDPTWTFGEELAVAGTPNDLLYLLDKRCREHVALPDLFMFCGREDILLDESRTFAARAEKLGAPLTYHEGEGEHLWTTWTKQVDELISWIEKKPRS